MQKNERGFFISPHHESKITEADYKGVQPLIEATKAFARCTHQCVYIMDYFKQCLIYVSENMKVWCEVSTEQAKSSWLPLYKDCVPKEDRQMLCEIHASLDAFFLEIPVRDRLDYTIYYDFHIIHGKKRRLVNHHLTPMVLTENGHLWLALCTFSMSSEDVPGHAIMKNPSSGSFYEYSFDIHRWTEKAGVRLNETERDILILSAKGYTVSGIAKKLYKSVDAIKSCKKSLFWKLGVKNTAEALSHSISYKLI